LLKYPFIPLVTCESTFYIDQISIYPSLQTVANLFPYLLNLQNHTYSLCLLKVAMQVVGIKEGGHV